MFEFYYPWLGLLALLPLLLWRLPAKTSQQVTLWLPQAPNTPTQHNTVPTRRWPALLFLLGWLALVIAMMRPTWIGEPVRVPQQHRDVMLALDLSGSMEIEDMQLTMRTTDRLSVSKKVLADFVSRREGDRLGLILFADHAYLQAPLTYDLNTVLQLVQETEIGLVGELTAIGEGIGLAVKRFIEADNEQKVLILLTDGQNTSGTVDPIKAAEYAKEQGVKIYTIGLGADEMLQRSLFGSVKVNPSADLDEESLSKIASMTGGQYFRARDPDDLSAIYQELDKLEPVASEARSYRPEKNLFYWPLAFAVALFGCATLVRRES
ncbi:vWA domain-containing protein [Motilimonas pumila]|uniref:VWA domain-containing protein n=1 Tax=Motilimonas pumila TaxID=2303987 RepID=A0A418YGA1_9GAMM|nr:VWA domain-containing protein [Motilimonas pumila]RJG48676.1 VWA domain-containing protein [Motilimonas pumila]